MSLLSTASLRVVVALLTRRLVICLRLRVSLPLPLPGAILTNVFQNYEMGGVGRPGLLPAEVKMFDEETGRGSVLTSIGQSNMVHASV